MRKIDLKKEREFENSNVLTEANRVKQMKYYDALRMKIDAHNDKVLSLIEEKLCLK